MHGGLVSHLSSDNCLSIGTDVQRQNIVSVELQVLRFVLALVSNLLASVVHLLTSGGVHDHAQSRYHKHGPSIERVSPNKKSESAG